MAQPTDLTIRRDWPRPSAAVLARFKDVPTCLVTDALGRSGALDHGIRPILAPKHFVGSALPIATGARDNLATFASLKFAKPGDVAMVATGDFQGTAAMGDYVIGLMKNAGIVAAITDGLVRDIAGFEHFGVAVYARGLTPNSPFRNGPGTVGLPIAIGGVTVAPGDIVVGDRDGIAIVPFARITEIADACAALRKNELELEAAIKAGAKTPGWLEKTLGEKHVRYID